VKKQSKPRCESCGEPLLRGATFCSHCKLHQGWRRNVPIGATIVTLAFTIVGIVSGVMPALNYYFERNSETRFKVTSSNANRLYLKVWNTGRRPSTLVAYRLLFDDLPNRAIVLDLDTTTREAAMNVIAPGEPVKIGLTRPLTTGSYSNQVDQFLADRIKSVIAGRLPEDIQMTLVLDVEESDDSSGESYHTRRDRFSASRIREFIEGSIRP